MAADKLYSGVWESGCGGEGRIQRVVKISKNWRTSRNYEKQFIAQN